MARSNRQQTVLDLLKGMGDPSTTSATRYDKFCRLFWTELNYQRVNKTLSRQAWNESAAKALAEDPVLFASAGQDNAFHVIYARLSSDRLLLGSERHVVSRLLRDHPYALFAFSDSKLERWHFLNAKYDKVTVKRRLFRRITVGPEERLRTASERIAILDLESISPDLFGLSPLSIQERHDEAFDVEAVTKLFFEEYKAVFQLLQDDLTRQAKSPSWAHDYSLQFLNRCMFLYFIQRKGWLGKDKEFLRLFWETYQEAVQPSDKFVDKWLKVLFFEALNKKFHGGHRQFPDKIREALALAPFLNGGLFTENDLDQRHEAIISDKRFEQVFKFFERYNFTIAEDSPLDKEVAVDPEMIGKVYESLVNVEETSADQRSAAGIFYTPRTEIDLMCRLALVDCAANHLGIAHKSLLNQLVFSLEPDEKVEADKAVTSAKLWLPFSKLLREITILDPACGSGSFLVGMLYILDDLQERADRHLGNQENPYDRKKRIIGQSLYGVDVMDWACHVAELRLWLALIIDAEFTAQELSIRRDPLLPHFSFKIRCGDSLVQEIGGINFGHMRGLQILPQEISSRIEKLKSEKLRFYDNDPHRQFKTFNQLKEEELRLFRNILDASHHMVQENIKSLRRKIEGPMHQQMRLDGTTEGQPHQMKLDAVEWRRQIESFEAELERIENSRSALKTIKDVPFVWHIAFVEIFEAEKKGFDIVIGNPPYVRQENIADPHLSSGDVTPEKKKAYKAKLARSLYQAFPRFFGYNAGNDSAAHKIDAKSDLYIYFYFHGLSLLNPKGSFCFITSNSWLDVGYGKDLQEFLLKHCHVKMILDNQARRSFAQADINTIIAIFSSPDDRRDWALEKSARFIMFKVPFEHILSPIIFDEIEVTHDRKTTPEYRAYPLCQKTLLSEGWEWPEDTTDDAKKGFGFALKRGKYGGNKLGSKYMRAPEIYHKLIQTIESSLVTLTSISEVEYGIKTGLTEFFYVDDIKQAEWGIEREYLIPFITSTQELKGYVLNPDQTTVKLFICHNSKSDLKKKNKKAALNYIEWGESQRTGKGAKHTISGIPFPMVPSVKGNSPWYNISNQKFGDFVMSALVRERYFFAANPHSVLVSNMFYQGNIKKNLDKNATWLALNSTITYFSQEILGRPNIGGRLNFYGPEFRYVLSPDPACLLKHVGRAKLKSAFEKFSTTPIYALSKEIVKPERELIDDLVKSSLKIPSALWNEMCNSFLELVDARSKKEKSL